jgi:catechol 2,3-dioxygenase-like lactoylglutathione lyase family enzyme
MRARRCGIVVVLLALGAVVALRQAPSPASQSPPPLVDGVGAVGITVSDMARAVDFYSRVLFFEKVSDVEVAGGAWERLQGVPGLRMRVVRMRLGDESIELAESLSPRGRPVPADSRSNDRWFQHIAIVVNDMDQAYLWLRRHRVAHVSPAPQRLPDWNAAAAGIRAFYFRDPDGHPLEIIEFPADKGARRWQRPSDRVFLGIDHTAIVVADTERSLAFYRDALGMRVAGGSENWGPEQERLNDVRGARLRITTLRAARGPGVELLEYLTPRDGRSLPPGATASDLVHWQTVLSARDAGAAETALRRVGATFVSPGRVMVPASPLGFRAGSLVRDPDGHALHLRSPAS